MRIGFIGAGRVGFTMGKYLRNHGCDITGYYSRNPEHAREAALFTDTEVYEDVLKLINGSDAIILTVSDSAISEVFDRIKDYSGIEGKILCHTSGSLSSRVFDDSPYQVYGYSIHPIYAISDKLNSYKHFSNAFITIEGHERYLDDIISIFRHAGNGTSSISASDKSKYHASCVMASNLVCGIYGAAIESLEECGIDKHTAGDMLISLFYDNVKGIRDNGLVKQLTGPIDRNDIDTVVSHLSVLSGNLRDIYIDVSLSTLRIAEEKYPDRDYTGLRKVLEEERP